MLDVMNISRGQNREYEWKCSYKCKPYCMVLEGFISSKIFCTCHCIIVGQDGQSFTCLKNYN
jgi:hypothetical protein